jgi:hypothetical protein
MEMKVNSYGFNVPKGDYEKLQEEVDKRNEIRMQSLIEFNKVLESVGIDTIGLDGYKSIRELTTLDVDGDVLDSRINRLPKPFKNPYDVSFEGMNEIECFEMMDLRIKEFYKIDVNKLYDNLALNMKSGFEGKVKSFVDRSINPIRFTLLNKIMEMSVGDFIKIYFRWFNNIVGENVFAPNYVINQWAWYFDIETEKEYDMITDEDMDEVYKSVPKYFQDDEDKEIRRHFYDYFN